MMMALVTGTSSCMPIEIFINSRQFVMLCKLEFQAQQILVSVFSLTPRLINMPSEMIACGQRCSGGFGY
jgi:hypothetical protein